MPTGSDFEKFQIGVNEIEETFQNDIQSIYDAIFPDRAGFTATDALNWERTLGLPTNELTDLADRKLAIIRKMNHPGTIKPRANYRYIQKQLRDAGFDVYVFENRFDDGAGEWETRTVQEVAISSLTYQIQHGTKSHGSSQHGQTQTYKIANHIDPNVDLTFDVGDDLFHTFFISSSTLGVNAVIPASREAEFRKLVLTLKPVQSVAYAFVGFADVVIHYVLNEDGGFALNEDGGKVIDYIE